jgi:hypothetical protein
MPWFSLIAKGIDIRGYVLFEPTYDPRRFGDVKPYHPTAYDAAKRYVLEGVASGNLKPALAESFPLDQMSRRIRNSAK